MRHAQKASPELAQDRYSTRTATKLQLPDFNCAHSRFSSRMIGAGCGRINVILFSTASGGYTFASCSIAGVTNCLAARFAVG